MQSAENSRKECHRFWLRLRHKSDSNFERSNISFKENIPDGVDPNSTVSAITFEEKQDELYGFRQTVW